MAGDEYVLRIVEDFGGDEDTSSKKKGGGVGSAIGAGIALGAGMAILGELLSIAKDTIGTIFSPIKSILAATFRIIGELLRPIVDVIVILLRPILILVKPLLDLFKTLMAPFMAIAKQFGEMARGQMAAGDVSGAMQTSMQAVQTLMGPFIVSLSSIAFQLLTSLLIGGIGNLLAMIFPFAEQAILGGSNAIIDKVNSGLTSFTQDILGGMLEDSQAKLEEYKKKYGDEYADAYIQTPLSSLQQQKEDISAWAIEAPATFKSGLDTMGLDATSAFDPATGTAVTKFQDGLNTMASAVDGFVDKMESAAKKIGGISSGSSGTAKTTKSSSVKVGLGIFSLKISSSQTSEG